MLWKDRELIAERQEPRRLTCPPCDLTFIRESGPNGILEPEALNLAQKRPVRDMADLSRVFAHQPLPGEDTSHHKATHERVLHSVPQAPNCCSCLRLGEHRFPHLRGLPKRWSTSISTLRLDRVLGPRSGGSVWE